jgi:hypothetical protein
LWLGFIHDLSNFLLDEFFPHAKCFYKPDDTEQYEPSMEYKLAHLKHCHRNPHQYQYWLEVYHGNLIPMPMPEKYIREMIADWTSSAIVYHQQNNTIPWYEKYKDTLLLHEETTKTLEKILYTTEG